MLAAGHPGVTSTTVFWLVVPFLLVQSSQNSVLELMELISLVPLKGWLAPSGQSLLALGGPVDDTQVSAPLLVQVNVDEVPDGTVGGLAEIVIVGAFAGTVTLVD